MMHSAVTTRRQVSPQARERVALVATIIVMLVGFGLARPQVLSMPNLQNIAIQSTYLIILACAQSIVIMTRGFDLSLGVTVSLASVVSALAMTTTGLTPWISIAAGISAGITTALVVSMMNGLLVASFGLNPFVVTLATMYVVLTLATTVSGGFPVSPLPADFDALSAGNLAGVPVPVIVALVVVSVLQALVKLTVFGRSITLLGTNSRAAAIAGIRVRSNLILAYLFCGFLTGLGAVLLTARTGSGEPNLGGDLTLQTIAAAVLGGIRLRGGEGDAFSPLLGALLVTVLSNGMNLLAIDGYLQQVLLGVVIILALAIDRIRSRSV